MPYRNGYPRNLFEVLGNTAGVVGAYLPQYLAQRRADEQYQQEKSDTQSYRAQQLALQQQQFAADQADREADRKERLGTQFYKMVGQYAPQEDKLPSTLEGAMVDRLYQGDAQGANTLWRYLQQKNTFENRPTTQKLPPNLLGKMESNFSRQNTMGYIPSEPEYQDLRKQVFNTESSFFPQYFNAYPEAFGGDYGSAVDSLRTGFGLAPVQPEITPEMARKELERRRAKSLMLGH